LGLALCLLASTQAAAESQICAENLSGNRGGGAPELIALTQLDGRIAANQDSKQRQRLELQRHLLLEQLTGRVFAGDTTDLVPDASAATLSALRREAQLARRDPSGDTEALAVLKLNTAVLDAAFAHLLDTLWRQWSAFAPASAFERSFAEFRRRTAFDRAPFEQAVARIETLPASKRSPADAELAVAYATYKQRADAYNTMIGALEDFVIRAASGDPLLRWLGVGALVHAVNALPAIADLNAALFPSRRLSLGQVVGAGLVFFAILAVGLLVWPLLVKGVGRLLTHLKKSPAAAQRLTRLLRKAFDTPVRVFLFLVALGMAGRVLMFREPYIGLLTVLGILVVLVVVWAVLRLIDNAVMVYSEKLHEHYPNLRGELVNFLSNLARFAVIIVTALYMLHDLGYDITTLLASLGIGGLAIAFAAKETIANVFGCISIIVDDMFRQGDWIVTADADGTVIDVGLRSTKIRTFDNAVVFIPNGQLAEVAVRNWSRRKLGRRILFTVGVEYGSDMKMVRKTVDDIRAMLAEHPAIADRTTDASQFTKKQLTRIANAMDSAGVMRTLLVYLDTLGESSINIMVYCFSKSVDWEEWLKVKQDVIFRCCDIVEGNGLSIAFPSRTVYLRGDAGTTPAKD
jgi:small-conductance mechanosensitive channel